MRIALVFDKDTQELVQWVLTSPDGSELTFHSDISEAGDYRLFAQVRVDGFLHTVPVELTVARSGSPS